MEKRNDYTANQVIEIIKNMDSSERFNLLEKMYEMYYNPRSDKKKTRINNT